VKGVSETVVNPPLGRAFSTVLRQLTRRSPTRSVPRQFALPIGPIGNVYERTPAAEA
jgi:hypothetical protein